LRQALRSLVLTALILGVPVLVWAGLVQVEPATLGQGQPALVRACLGKEMKSARAVFLGQDAPLIRGLDGCFLGVVAADLLAKPGAGKLVVIADDKPSASARVEVALRNYGERRITVAAKFMSLTPQQLSRHKKELKAQRQVYDRVTPQRFWRDGFVKPVPGTVTGPFGRRSVVNGKPRSPHGGVDFRGAKGTPVAASGGGRVALVQDSFFGGKVVLIDHGQGVVTGYRHLDSIKVKNGQMVAKGQEIGQIGMTGRVTGPHLHFDVHIGGARVDPLAWINLSQILARRLAGR